MNHIKAKPNIIFITTDTQGQNMISSYGINPSVKTPNIDSLAEQGVLFENSFTSCPLCTPARSSWFTGLHPNRNGAMANKESVMRQVPMLAEIFSGIGYRTYHFGKWHLDGGDYNGNGETDGGFDEPYWYDLSNFYGEVGREGINRFGGWNKGLENEEYCFGHQVANQAIDILKDNHKQNTDNPYFLTVSFDEPHGPYICPPPFRGMFSQDDIYIPDTFMADMEGKPELQKNYVKYLAKSRPTPETYIRYYHKYYDCNTYIDYEIGRVLDAVDKYCDENTIVIYTSDHGDHLGNFGLAAKGPTMYDCCTAVPLIIRAPELSKRVKRISSLVSSVDIWPTILEFAGIDYNKKFDIFDGYTGKSLIPLITGKEKQVRDTVFMEYNRFGRTHTGADGFFPIRSIRTNEWKLNINLFDKDELYYIKEDPEERDNLINENEYSEIRNQLHDKILNWQDETRDLLRGPCWGQRDWREDYQHQFEGYFTTGYKDEWESGSFFINKY